MKKALKLYTLITLLFICACNNINVNNSIVGIWKEYRADPNDDYGLSSWKFNDDGSGLFIVEGITNTQKVSFTWEKVNSSTIIINLNGEETILELSNGLLIGNSALGCVVFKKQ